MRRPSAGYNPAMDGPVEESGLNGSGGRAPWEDGTVLRVSGVASGTARVPTSKSIAQRALVAAALCHGRTRFGALPDGEDVAFAARWADQLGLVVARHGRASLSVQGCPPGPSRGLGGLSSEPWRVGESGTLARLLLGVAGLASWVGRTVTVEASGSLLRREPGPLLGALARAGSSITPRGGPWPVQVTAVGPPSEVLLDAPRSSQEVSSLLLALAAWPDHGALRVRGVIPSAPYVGLTRWTLERFGVQTEEHLQSETERVFFVKGPLRAPEQPFLIEPDASAASVALAAACLSGGRVTVPGLSRDSAQGDVRIVEHLRAFGCGAGFDETGAWAEGSAVRGASVDLGGEPDLAPVLVPMAVSAARRVGGTSELTGLGTLEGKESPRLSVLAGFCRSLGCAVEASADGLVIGPSPGATGGGAVHLEGHGDHRMVFAALLLGLVEPGVRVSGHRAVAKSWARALTDLEGLGLRFDESPHG